MDARVLMLDYGGVLGDHYQEPAQSQLAAALGVTVDMCRELTSERSPQGRAFREDRICETEFWDEVWLLGGRPIEERLPDATLSRMWSETYALNGELCALLARARRSTPIGILTNIDRARSAYLVERVGVLRLVDLYLPSYRFGIVKPYEQLWAAAAREIQANYPGSQVYYVDDRPTHVDACGGVGWQGIPYTGIGQLTDQLLRLNLISEDDR